MPADGPSANSGSDSLTVINTSGAPTALAATVATGDVPDAIAVSPDQATAVVSNEGAGTVSIFHVAPKQILFFDGVV